MEGTESYKIGRTNEYSGNDYFKESKSSFYNMDPFVQELLSNSESLDTSKITKLIETILSPTMLQSDIVSYMTKSGNNMTLHLSTLLSIPIIQKLNINEDDMITALKNSKFSYDDTMKVINIGLKVERKTAILLNAPEDVTTDEIHQFFGELSSEITEARRETENTWYITFTCENSAIEAVSNCIGKKLNDTKVNLRMKSENLVKNTTFGNMSYLQNPNHVSHWQMNSYYQNYPYYKNEHVPNNSKSLNRINHNKFRGKGNRKQNPRQESDSNQSSLQIMGNGDIVYTKRNNFNYKGGKNGNNFKEKKVQPTKRRENYQAPHLGMSDFPPLGKKSSSFQVNGESHVDKGNKEKNGLPSDNVNGSLNILSDPKHGSQVDSDSKLNGSESKLLHNHSSKIEEGITDNVDSQKELVIGISELEVQDKENNRENINEMSGIIEGLLNGNESNGEFIAKDCRMRPNWAEIAKARGSQ